jgi:hypothetical protein
MTARYMRIAIALLAALTPLAAGAVTLTVNGLSQEVRIGINDCKSLQLIARWDLQTTPTGTDRIRLIGASNGSGACSSTTATAPPDRTFLDATPAAQTDFATLSASDMVLSTSDAGVQPCDDPNVTSRSSANPLTNMLCLQYSLSSVFGGSSVSTASVNVKYALAPPFPPIDIGIAPGDGHLKLSWSKGDDAEMIVQYDVHVEPEIGGTDGGVAATVTSTHADVSTTDDGQPLQNDAGYLITIVATDSYGNVSQPSLEVLGIPVATADFYSHYRDEGGSARGCASGGASLWIAGIAIAVSLLLRRRSKARNTASLVALLAVLAPAARAAESERQPRFLIGFKIDRYDPKVDSEPGLTGTPYHDVFGTRKPLRYQLEFDWEVAHPFGALLVGATVGFWQNYGKAILRSSPPGNPQPSQDTTVLNVFPFGLMATYRFDWLANRWSRFPFIPYAQAGLMRALWVSYNGKGDVPSDPVNGGRGKGWTNGYTAALGLALSLNVIDVELAREAYVDTGIQRTSLFAEYGWTFLDNFGRGGALILTDRAWRFGLAVEF